MKRVLKYSFALVVLFSSLICISASARVPQKVVRYECKFVKDSELDLYSGVISYGFTKKGVLVDSTFYELKKNPDTKIPEVRLAWEQNRVSLQKIVAAMRSNKRSRSEINETAINYTKHWAEEENALRLKKKNELIDSLYKERLSVHVADSVSAFDNYHQALKNYDASVKSRTYATSSIVTVNSVGGVTTCYRFSVKKPIRKIVLTRAFYNAWGERIRGEFPHQYSATWTLEGTPGETDNLYSYECESEFYSMVADHVKILSAKVYYVDGTTDNAKLLNTPDEVSEFFPVRPKYPRLPSRASLRGAIEAEIEKQRPEFKKVGLYSKVYDAKLEEYKQQLAEENTYWDTRVRSLLDEYSAYGLE